MVKESVIRLMTRLALKHGAVNLSQGFPNECPPAKIRLALAHAVLSGNVSSSNEASRLSHATEKDLSDSIVSVLTEASDETPGIGALTDELNQYSPPMGRADARRAVSAYYDRLYDYDISEDNITLTLGATEAVATALRTICCPGDKVVIFEPFHEIYPSQCGIFYLDPLYVTMHASVDEGSWSYDYGELKDAIVNSKTKALILNTPHNPTGKVFSHEELKAIVDLCIENDVYIITDEIYEHMTYPDDNNTPREHILIPKEFPEAAGRTLICNSLGKSASATGWRLGWCLHPPHLSDLYRGVHDQMVCMAPHAMQFASMAYFTLPRDYFEKELRVRYQSRVSMLAEALDEVGFGIIHPEGAYYLFADYRGVSQLRDLTPMDAAMYLMHEVGVAVVPGDNFYGKAIDEGKKYLRFAACRSMADIATAIERLRANLSASES